MEHYYSETQSSEEGIVKIKIALKDDSFELFSANGLFSKMGLDTATKLLIEKAEIKGNKILDLGCGYGVVGIALLRKHEYDMTFSDINERAVKITEKNLKKQKLKGKIIKSDLFGNIKENYDVILSNPPYAAGRKVCFKLIEDSYVHLNKGGVLQIVARHQKGGKALAEKMRETFGNVRDVAKSSGFRVYLSEKND